MKPTCSLCGASTAVTACGDGHLCEPCAEANRTGRDSTTRKAKLAQRALIGKADIARVTASGGNVSDLDVFAVESAALLALEDRQDNPLLGAGGEALPQANPELRDTMATPGATALDASAERLRLVSQVGVDCVALGLDAADSIKAANSLEKALAHQLAAAHTVAMDFMARANLQQNPEHSVKMMNLAVRCMDVYQRGLVTLKRLRSDGQQQIVIKHIDARGGGMVAVGSVPPSGPRGRFGETP